MGRPDCSPGESDDNSDLSGDRDGGRWAIMSEVEIRGLDVGLMEWQLLG